MSDGGLLRGTHLGDGEVARTEAYGGVPVRWTTHDWQPEHLVALLSMAGLDLDAELRIPVKAGCVRPRRSTPPAGLNLVRAGRQRAGTHCRPGAGDKGTDQVCTPWMANRSTCCRWPPVLATRVSTPRWLKATGPVVQAV